MRLICRISGYPFDPKQMWHGMLRRPQDAELLRKGEEQLHRRLARDYGMRVERETGADTAKREILKP